MSTQAIGLIAFTLMIVAPPLFAMWVNGRKSAKGEN